MSIDWQDRYAERVRTDNGPTLGNLLGFNLAPGYDLSGRGVSRGGVLPSAGDKRGPGLHPLTDPFGALQYGPTEGHPPLRDFIAKRMANVGVRASAEEVLITTGSQQGLDLVGRLLIDPGSIVAVEDPSYAGGLQAFDGCQARYLAVPIDQDGMRVDLLEGLLAGGGAEAQLYLRSAQLPEPFGHYP